MNLTNVRIKFGLVLIIFFFLSCKQAKKEDRELLSKIDDISKIKYVDFSAMEGIKIRYFIGFDSIQVYYPNDSKRYLLRENKHISKVKYYPQNRGLDIHYDYEIDNTTANLYENIISIIEFASLSQISKVEYYTDIEERNKHKTLFLQEYYLNGNIEKTIHETDSLVNNDIDSLPCHYLIRKYYKNGQLKTIGCGTNEYGYASETPLGIYKYYDSIGNIKKSIFYHVNDSVFKGYKIIKQYDKKGNVISKVKTLNDWLDDISADTLKVYK